MRKTLILLVALALVGAAAFADGTTAKWSVSTNEGIDFVSNSAGTTVGEYDYSQVGTGRVRFLGDLVSSDGNVGFNSRFQMVGSNYKAAAFNQLNAWGKLFGGMLTVRAGMLDDYTIATPIWNCYGNTDGSQGIYLDLAPVAGLDIGVFQPIVNAGVDISKFYNGTIIGAAFAAKDVVNVQAGAILSSTADSSALYLGADLKAVAGLTAQLEAKYTLSSTTALEALENFGYSFGAFSVAAYVGELVTGSTFDWGVEPSVSYKVNDNLKINAVANVYSNASRTWMSPIDVGVFGSAATSTAAATGVFAATGVGFGGGASVSYAASGATLTLGDYYAAATGGGNAVYLNFDVSL